ncbi:MAG: peptide/nickel transport system permease protein [Actinomycetota bacterium]|jgi:peptide/nickel transport system permease protein|nr:peptide/nickel transport system permease protein [Actinomycetota bacterium]
MAKVEAEPDQLQVAPSADTPKEIIGRSPGQILWRRFRKDRWAIGGIVVIIIIVILAITAPLFAKWVGHPVNQSYVDEMTGIGPSIGIYGHALGFPKGPTLHNPAGVFPFGADGTAHDLFIQVLYGAQTSLEVALSATLIEVVLGVAFGIVAGFYGGKIDTIISRMCDIFFALPTLLLILGISAACGGQPPGQECLGGYLKPGKGLIVILIGFFSWPYLARIIRGQVLSIREKEFIEAARSLGSSGTRIMVRDILPNVLAPVIVYSTLLIPTNILAEASLSFLGLGVPPDVPSWGYQISQATSLYRTAWWTMVFPGAFLFLTTLAFNLVGDGLRDAFDPKTA